MPKPTISRYEWRNVLLLAVIVLAITTLPYVVGWLSQTDEWRFNGFMFGGDDGNSYLAKMRQGAAGSWLFRIVYTSEPHDGALVFVPYLLGGNLAALMAGGATSPALNDWLLIVFHAARIMFGGLLIMVTYRFVAYFILPPFPRLLTTALIAVGGGLGWLLILLGQDNLLGSSPLDVIVPEGYTFYLLYGLPHLSLARIGLLIGMMLIFDEDQRTWLRRSLLAGLCWLVMVLCVPFYLAVLGVLLGLWGIAAWIRTRRFPVSLFWRCLVAGIVPLPYVLYTLIVFSGNSIMAAWQAQNQLPSPHPLHYLFGYGVLLVLAIPILPKIWRKGHPELPYLLLLVWGVGAPLLAYLPINVQRRMVEGMFVPLCILAVIGLTQRRRWEPLAAITFIVLTLTTAIILLTGTLNAARPSSFNQLYSSTALIRALRWLDDQAADGAVVLSTVAIGNATPAQGNLRAFVGHGPETIRFAEKAALAAQVLNGEIDVADRSALFMQYSIEYVVAPPEALIRESDDLVLVHDEAGYRVFQVVTR